MLDDDDGVPGLLEALEHIEELLYVREMKPGRGLVEDVDGLSGGPPGELLGELYPLRLSAGQGGRGLADLYVAEPHIMERLELLPYGRDVLEEGQSLGDRQVKALGDVSALVPYLQRVPVIPVPPARLAGDIDIREEVHLDLDEAVPFAGFAPAALDIEAEPAGVVAPHLGLGELAEKLPYGREQSGIGRRV